MDYQEAIENYNWLEVEFEKLKAENEALKTELEAERIRLAACSVAALENTEESIKNRLTPENEYYSASYDDVCRAVDREMKHRSRLANGIRVYAWEDELGRCYIDEPVENPKLYNATLLPDEQGVE